MFFSGTKSPFFYCHLRKKKKLRWSFRNFLGTKKVDIVYISLITAIVQTFGRKYGDSSTIRQ